MTLVKEYLPGAKAVACNELQAGGFEARCGFGGIAQGARRAARASPGVDGPVVALPQPLSTPPRRPTRQRPPTAARVLACREQVHLLAARLWPTAPRLGATRCRPAGTDPPGGHARPQHEVAGGRGAAGGQPTHCAAAGLLPGGADSWGAGTATGGPPLAAAMPARVLGMGSAGAAAGVPQCQLRTQRLQPGQRAHRPPVRPGLAAAHPALCA